MSKKIVEKLKLAENFAAVPSPLPVASSSLTFDEIIEGASGEDAENSAETV